MKRITVEEFSKQATALLKAAQRERVVVMKNGEPLAVLVGIENKDEEDLALERDETFWQMIHERRKEKTVSFADVKERLGLNDEKSANNQAKTKK